MSTPTPFFILIIDDNINQVKAFINKLKEKGFKFYYARTLDQAHDYIIKNSETIDHVIIDLYLPDAYSKLDKYIDRDGVNLDQGHLFKNFLDKEYKSIKYSFLSALDMPQGKGIEEDTFFSKSMSGKKKLIDRLIELRSEKKNKETDKASDSKNNIEEKKTSNYDSDNTSLLEKIIKPLRGLKDNND